MRLFLEEWADKEALLAEAYPCPWLIVYTSDHRIAHEEEPTEAHSILWFKPTLQQWQIQALESVVLPIQKRKDANGFLTLVTIGRGAKNDLVLPYPGISKFHAYFAKATEWSIYDAKSRNGTSVQGRQLEKGASELLRERDVIHLGEQEAMFLSLEGMLELMRELRPEVS